MGDGQSVYLSRVVYNTQVLPLGPVRHLSLADASGYIGLH